MKPLLSRRHLLLSIFLAQILLFSRAVNSQQNSRTFLIDESLSQFSTPLGDWRAVEQVFMRSDDKKFLEGTTGTGSILNGATGRTINLKTRQEFGDIKLHVEFMVPQGSNSGIYLMGRYEVQIFDSWGVKAPTYSDCGGIYQRWDDLRMPKGYEGHAPSVNASFPPGDWQSFDIVFRAPRFDTEGRKIENARFVSVIHNGYLVHENVTLTGPTRASAFNDEQPTGPLMLQGDHGPVAYRNLYIQPIEMNDFFAMDTGTRDDQHQTIQSQVEVLRRFGYDGVDHTGCANIPELLFFLDSHHLRLYALYLNVWIDPIERQYEDCLEEAIRLLKGRPVVLWLAVRSRQAAKSDSLADPAAIAVLQKVAAMAVKSNLKIALYPHTGFWLERVEDAVRVVQKLNNPDVGVTFNLCHLLRVGDAPNVDTRLKTAMPYLFMVTINGADHQGTWKELIQPLDSGAFDVAGLVRKLRVLGYTGPIGLQGYGIGGNVEQNLRRSMNAWIQINDQIMR